MTDKPTPKEIDDLVYELRQAGKDDTYSLVCAVLAKWGQPVVAGDVDRADAVNLARNALTQYDCAITKKGVRVLAEAVLSMDSALTTPQPTQAQAGAVPLDEARHLFDAGWKAAALFCDREDVVADGIIGFGACPQFEAAFSAAQPVAREPMTNAHIRAMLNKHPPEDVCDWSYRMGIDDAELHHGIKGGQHDAG